MKTRPHLVPLQRKGKNVTKKHKDHKSTIRYEEDYDQKKNKNYKRKKQKLRESGDE